MKVWWQAVPVHRRLTDKILSILFCRSLFGSRLSENQYNLKHSVVVLGTFGGSSVTAVWGKLRQQVSRLLHGNLHWLTMAAKWSALSCPRDAQNWTVYKHKARCYIVQQRLRWLAKFRSSCRRRLTHKLCPSFPPLNGARVPHFGTPLSWWYSKAWRAASEKVWRANHCQTQDGSVNEFLKKHIGRKLLRNAKTSKYSTTQRCSAGQVWQPFIVVRPRTTGRTVPPDVSLSIYIRIWLQQMSPIPCRGRNWFCGNWKRTYHYQQVVWTLLEDTAALLLSAEREFLLLWPLE